MDQDELENVIMECIAAGLPELDADIEKARQISQDLEMQRHRGQIETISRIYFRLFNDFSFKRNTLVKNKM